jgi:hypothetical protein
LVGGTLTRDAHTPPPHLKFALLANKTQVCGDQASLCKCSLTKSYQGVVGDAAHMFSGVTCPSFFSISTGTQRTTYPKNMLLLLFEREIKPFGHY